MKQTFLVTDKKSKIRALLVSAEPFTLQRISPRKQNCDTGPLSNSRTPNWTPNRKRNDVLIFVLVAILVISRSGGGHSA